MTCSPQQIKKVSDQNRYKKEDRWLTRRQYIYPVDNSESFNPRDRDYQLVRNWEFNNKEEFLTEWERLDGIRGNQLMYFRDNDMHYGFERNGANSYLHLKTYQHNPRVLFNDSWPSPYSLSYEYSTAECITKDSYMYGYFEARIKIPGFRGAHSAFWLFSKGHNGNALEIDIMEATSGGLLGTRRHTFTSNFSEYFHPTANADKREFVYQDDLSNSLSDAFHIYAVEWTPFDLRYYFDNQLIRVEKIPDEWEVFPCFVRLGVEVDHWNPPNEKVFDPMIVDYIKVYQKDELKAGVQRPQIEYNDRIIKADEWIIASVKNRSRKKNYYWKAVGNVDYYVDKSKNIHFKLKSGESSSTIIGLTSADKSGSSEKNAWKEQVMFTNRLPLNFKLLVYKTKCNEDGKGRVTVKSQDLRKYGVYSTTFNVYSANNNSEIVGLPIESLKVPSPGEGGFWLDPKKQYWIEHIAEVPDGGPESIARIKIYPVLDPTFSPRVYMKEVGGRQRIFVDGKGVNPNQIHRWSLYRTDLKKTFMDLLDSYESPGSKTFCFDLSLYPGYDHFVIVHEMEQANEGKCFSTETREMYFTSKKYKKKPPADASCQ